MKRLFYNGSILTMDGTYTEALLIQDGMIQAVGTLREMERQCDPQTERTDLAGCALLPGFIDGHSHLTSVARTMGMIDLRGADSFEEILRRMQEYQKTNSGEYGDWLMGFGYDHTVLKEGKHPDAALLDQVSTDRPVMITHTSFHMGVVNHAALKRLRIGEETLDPDNGKIGRVDGSSCPNGYLEEGAFMQAGSQLPSPSEELMHKRIREAEQYYFSYGITTIQDGMTDAAGWNLLRNMAEAGELTADIVAYTDVRLEKTEEQEKFRAYCGHLKWGGYKLFLDGSPQGRTAWMLTPYVGSDFYGYPVHSDEEVKKYTHKAVKQGVQLLTHCNGDAAAEQLISAFEQEEDFARLRPVMIHAQLVRGSQLKRMGRLGIIASFFPAHVYYWGDVHMKNFGLQRASAISPVRTAMEAGVICNLHQDTPVIAPNMLETMWCAVRRMTKGKVCLGAEYAITPYEALRAVTKDAAFAYFEESKKGTLTPGKKADMIILDRSPLSCPPDELRKVAVLETIKDGKTVYQKEKE
ncbi:amidohydrolase [Ructibacterium gallinarum]|uniref:Amidohydrolase n=1 Tax=Ructibacterium gallinarum TaxID=2779355 RepID=A0A9D5RBK1_9FIRM|nr:amidohydrolase [Ructibacterium gallinarum]MBE5040108.1 amidohydrolase [Ructibacterium gallinarum]